MSQPRSLFVKRTLLQVEHASLREHMDRFNQQMPDTILQWRRLGEVSVMMVQSGEYETLTQLPRSRLRTRPLQQVAKDLNDNLLKDYERKIFPLQTTKFLGNKTARYIHIGFEVDPTELIAEREEIRTGLDKMNRAPGDWRHQFRPYLSMATLNQQSATEQVLTAFQDIMPETVTLYEARAQVS